MAWAPLRSCRARLQCLTSRTLVAQLSIGSSRIPQGSLFRFVPLCVSSHQTFSTSTSNPDAIDASSTVNKADEADLDMSAMRSAIIQAVQELPIMTTLGVNEYAEKCYAESREPRNRDQSWSAAIPWLKGYLSGVVYPKDIKQHDKAAYAHCISPNLKRAYQFIRSILAQLGKHDIANRSPYNMNILSQYLQLLDCKEKDELCTAFKTFLLELNLDNLDNSTRLDIECSETRCVQFRKLIDNCDNKSGLTVQKVEILLLPFSRLDICFSILWEKNDIVLDELLYAFQKQLPKAVLARFLAIIHVSDQKRDIGDKLRHVLIQAISELPLLTPGTLESYSRERFEEVKQLSIKESEHEPATRLLFKWCLSRVLYTDDAQAHENLGGEFVTTDTLPPGMDGMNKLLFNVHDKAPVARYPYTLGIMDHFNTLLQEAEEGIEHCDLRAKYTLTLKNIKFHDMDEDMAEGLSILGYPVYNQFCSELITLAESVPHSDLIDISILMELGELRKACILITAGGDCIGYSVPYLVRTYFITAWIRSPKFASLLIYSYQQILSPNLFELVIMFIWMFVHTKKSDGYTAELSLPVPPNRGAKQSKAAQDLSES